MPAFHSPDCKSLSPQVSPSPAGYSFPEAAIPCPRVQVRQAGWQSYPLWPPEHPRTLSPGFLAVWLLFTSAAPLGLLR